MKTPAAILVIDDNPINLKLGADVLECEGYLVFRAGSAMKAEEIMTLARPDLILMDIQMPVTDGLTLTRRWKGNAAFREIPIVAMTAFAMKGDEEKAMEAGCDGYITKPIDTRKLPGLIEEVLRRSGGLKPGGALRRETQHE